MSPGVPDRQEGGSDGVIQQRGNAPTSADISQPRSLLSAIRWSLLLSCYELETYLSIDNLPLIKAYIGCKNHFVYIFDLWALTSAKSQYSNTQPTIAPEKLKTSTSMFRNSSDWSSSSHSLKQDEGRERAEATVRGLSTFWRTLFSRTRTLGFVRKLLQTRHERRESDS